jgi:hypothetical protein
MSEFIIAVDGNEMDAKKAATDLQMLVDPQDVLVMYYHYVPDDIINDFNVVMVQLTTQKDLPLKVFPVGTVVMTETSNVKDVFSQCCHQYIHTLETMQNRVKSILSKCLPLTEVVEFRKKQRVCCAPLGERVTKAVESFFAVYITPNSMCPCPERCCMKGNGDPQDFKVSENEYYICRNWKQSFRDNKWFIRFLKNEEHILMKCSNGKRFQFELTDGPEAARIFLENCKK